MPIFQNWLRTQNPQVRRPNDLNNYWEIFAGINFDLIATYERGLVAQGRTVADTDPAQLLATANAAVLPVTLQQATQTLYLALDALSARIEQLAAVQTERERVELRVQAQNHRERPAAADQNVVVDAQTCTVRIQVQTNFKQKGGTDMVTSETLDDPAGVSVANLDLAFERVVAACQFNNKFTAKLREAYDIHQAAWHSYRVGDSNSVNFDETKIVTGGRPRGGYRLDIENIRVAPGRQNFI